MSNLKQQAEELAKQLGTRGATVDVEKIVGLLDKVANALAPEPGLADPSADLLRNAQCAAEDWKRRYEGVAILHSNLRRQIENGDLVHLDQITREAEQKAALDALRYRWLRDVNNQARRTTSFLLSGDMEVIEIAIDVIGEALTLEDDGSNFGSVLDAAIDAAIEQQDTAPPAPSVPETSDEVEQFLDEVRAELNRARAKFPGDRIMTIALAEEFGELCKAILEESAENVRKEAIQTAVMAARVALDGDGSVVQWRTERGLDQITMQHNRR